MGTIARRFVAISTLAAVILMLGCPEVDPAGFFSLPEPVDSDGDGLLDPDEEVRLTDPNNPDTDGDGLLDGEEINTYGTNPLLPDTDFDLLTDGDEVQVYGTSPLLPDSDVDGLLDYNEILLGTDPLNSDTDGDLFLDGVEIELGLNPTTPNAIGFIATVYCAGFASVLGLPYSDDIGVYGLLLILTGNFLQGVFPGDMVVQIHAPPISLVKVYPAFGEPFTVGWRGILGVGRGFITDAVPEGLFDSMRIFLSSGFSYQISFLENDEIADWHIGDYVVIVEPHPDVGAFQMLHTDACEIVLLSD